MRKVKILGHEYDIIFDEKWMHKSNNYESCSFAALKIILDSSVPKKVQKQWLIHAIVEAINFHLELDLSHSTICAISESFYQILKDNNLDKIVKN